MNKKSIVVVLPCEAYEEEKIYNLLKAGLKELGGLEALIGKDEKLLLKPNLLKKAEVEKAVITHPVVVGAFARILREEGYANIVLADSCGHGTTRQVIQGTGMDTYLEKYEIPAIDYTKGVHVDYPQGVQAREFILPKELLEADCVISLSKMKTHALERITGAVKNSYGFIYGKIRQSGHTRISKCRQLCAYADRSESICEAEALYYGWNHGDGRQRSRVRRSDCNECNPYVHRSGGTGQRVCKAGVPEAGDGANKLPWRKDGTWILPGREY